MGPGVVELMPPVKAKAFVGFNSSTGAVDTITGSSGEQESSFTSALCSTTRTRVSPVCAKAESDQMPRAKHIASTWGNGFRRNIDGERPSPRNLLLVFLLLFFVRRAPLRGKRILATRVVGLQEAM